jgi:hypothetical protein
LSINEGRTPIEDKDNLFLPFIDEDDDKFCRDLGINLDLELTPYWAKSESAMYCLPCELEKALLSTKSSTEFIDTIPPDVLGYIEPELLTSLSSHLLKTETRSKRKRKDPVSTVDIMNERKRIRNRKSAKKCKAASRSKSNTMKHLVSALVADIKGDPSIEPKLSQATRDLLNSL